MKKLFALLAVVLAVVSCQKDVDNLDVNVGGEQLVNITVGLPEETRAVSGTGFDLSKTNLEENDLELRYILEIYAKGNTTDCIRKEVFTTEKTVVFPVRLIHGRDYHVVAWADIVPVSATERTAEDDYDHHYETSNGLTAVEIISWNAMDETRDAFTTFADIEDFSANRSLDLRLVRPFAKIRVVSTDIKDIEDLGFELGRGEVTYRYDMHRKFNAYTGIASDAASKGHTFTYPTPYEDDSYEDNTYETETQRTLFADYIFVDNVNTPDVVQFTMKVWDKADLLIKETPFMTDIPVHANKLTTIIGEVLTEGGNVKVTIDNNLAEQEPVTVVSSASHLLKVINAGGDYILGNNIDVTAKDVAEAEGIITRAGEAKTTTINLNGYTISLQANVEVKAGNTLIIDNQPLNDNGGDKGAVINADGAIVNNGTLVIEGGNYSEGAIENNGTTNVNGGDFADNAIENNGNVTIEGDNSDRSDDIVTDGNNATLHKVVYNKDELQAALNAKNADVIYFGADIEGEATISQTEGVNIVINGNDHKFDGTLYIHGNSRYADAETLTIKNINFEADAAKYFIDSNDTDPVRRYAHNVTIENCTFKSLAGDNSVAVCGIRFRQAYDVNIKGCTATNTFYLAWFTGCNNTTIDNCRAINNYEGITLGNGTTTTIKGSSIDADLYGIRVESNHSNYSDTHNVTIENCAFDAFIPVSARNLKSGKVNIELKGQNTLTRRGGDYDIALCANEYKAGVTPTLPTGEWEITGAENYVVFPYQWAVANADELQNAINKANADVKINFTADIEGEIMIQQKANVNLTIDGQGKKFDGTFTIDGMNRYTALEFVKFQNINFYAKDASKYYNSATSSMNFIYAPKQTATGTGRSAHNVFVEDCTFDKAVDNVTVSGLLTEQSYGITIKNSTFSNLFSIGQFKANNKFTKFEGVTTYKCESGANFNTAARNVTFDNCNITATKVDGYAVRADGNNPGNMIINGCTFEAYRPIVVRNMTNNFELELQGENTFTNNDIFDIIFTDKKDDQPLTTPTGEWNITGADDYIVYPRDYAGTQEQLDAALANSSIKNIILGTGKFTAEIYLGGTVARDSLTITGTEGSQIEFDNQQVLSYLFKDLTIKNCEILHMASKSWGMLVLDRGQSEGVYTVDNCTFTGVGTTGIYINEKNNGVTYNIKNCEFNGDFGVEGAISIQNDPNKNFTVNVTGCEFNNIPETSHEIYVHYDNDDMTLNAEGVEVYNPYRQ